MVILYNFGRFSQKNGGIWLSSVQCTADDVFLADCNHPGFGNVLGCSRRDSVAVLCNECKSFILSLLDLVHGSKGRSA